MPDCSLFCVLSMQLAKGKCERYNEGKPKIRRVESLAFGKNETKAKKSTSKVLPKVKKQAEERKRKVGKQPRLFEL